MIYLVYVSSATKLFSEAELVELLRQARARNSHSGITGMLLYSNGNFIQVIEGEETIVLALHQNLMRQRNPVVLHCTHVQAEI